MKRPEAIARVVMCGFMAVCGRYAAAQIDPVTAPPATTNLVSTMLVAQNATVPLGAPIKLSLSVDYRGATKTQVDTSWTAFDCFEVTDAEGRSPTYVGFVGQIISRQVDVAPSSTVHLATELDLTDKYLLDKVGRYTIRFKGDRSGIVTATIIPPRSNTITVDVRKGELSEQDGTVARLLPICPPGWAVSKSPRAEQEVTPFGRTRVAGFGAHMGRHWMGGDTVLLWLTKVEAAVNADSKSELKSEYLGRCSGMHAYVTLGSKAKDSWPTAIDDIARVLKIEKE